VSEEDPGSALPVVVRRGPTLPATIEGPLDVALGAAVVVARPVVAVGAAAGRAVAPVARGVVSFVLRPPFLAPEWTLGAVVDRLGDQGRTIRYAAGEDLTVITGQSLDVVMPTVVEPVLDRLDLTGIVLQRVDLERLVVAVLDTMDLTAVVLDRVDLHTIVEAALDSLDLNDVVRSRVDLAGIAEEVIDEVDLPEIIRESSTGVASEVVDATRMSAVGADELVSRWVDRFLLRRQQRRTQVANVDLESDLDDEAAHQGERQDG
jgi:hypothetical protein